VTTFQLENKMKTSVTLSCSEVRHSIVHILSEGVKHPRLHFILRISKLFVKYRFRRYWFEHVGDTACRNLLHDFTRPEYLDRWYFLPFKTAYDEMLQKFFEVAYTHSNFLGLSQ
jgi:hypothetical protein